MVELTFKSPGVSAREIDLSGPTNTGPVGTPAGIIGTAVRGPAFVPVTLGSFEDFSTLFGPTDGEKFGPLAASEWLKNATALTYVRVLGVGKGEKRTDSGDNAGRVESAGFVVGEEQPNDTGNFGRNANAVDAGNPGRTHILGCYMSESAGSTILSDAGIQQSGENQAHPIIRAVILAASGVIPLLSSTLHDQNDIPSTTDPATAGASTLQGALTGTVVLLDGTTAKQEFVLLLNGHLGTNASFPSAVTASFDVSAPNYFSNVLNQDPFKLQDAGYVMYTHYDIHPAMAAVTGTGLLTSSGDFSGDAQEIGFLTTGSADRNAGSATGPSYENFEDRFATPKSPYVISQKFGGNPVNLFRFHSLSDGAVTNQSWKISIENLAPSTSEVDQYGTFDVVIRSLTDTDDSKEIIEQFRGLSLNPGSDRFIAKAIGDKNIFFDFDRVEGAQKLVFEGQYDNVSSFVRVQVTDALLDGEVESTALPAGFRGHFHLVTSGTSPLTAVDGTNVLEGDATDVLFRAVEPPTPMRKNITVGQSPKLTVNKNFFWGVQFEQQLDVNELNKSRAFDETVKNMTSYFSTFHTTYQNVSAGDNEGTADAAATGILDADRFNNNLFSLENIQVVTGTDAKADLKEVDGWTYVRAGNITANAANKTRAFTLTDDLTKLGVRSLAKFSFFLQGGFDGINIFNRNESDLNNRAITEEMNFPNRGQDEGPTVRSYRRALDLIGLTSEVDINLLAIPGVRHAVLTDAALITVQNRFDALYIMDLEERDSVNTVVTSSLQDVNVQNTVNSFNTRNLDNNFGAAYFPDLIITDPTTNTNVQVPPSVGVIGAFSLNDALAFPWFAAAGFTRGVMDTVTQTAVKLNRDNLDDLYEARINPITAFPGGPGVVVWGQKTLQGVQSALDRVNVRRLLLELRRRVRGVANQILFEPNREDTIARFESRVNPILQRIQEQSGVNRYKVQIDTTTTTQADIENNTIRGLIFIEPTRTAEFIALDFVVTNAGVSI